MYDLGAADKQFVANHPELYHYTTINGLTGILSSNCLRATSFRYLNDKSEVFRLKLALKEMLLPKVADHLRNRCKQSFRTREKVRRLGGLPYVPEKHTESVLDAIFNAAFKVEAGARAFAETYIVSFCTHPDRYEKENGLLSQWRGYGGKGGVAIIFDSAEMIELIDHENNRFDYVTRPYMADVIYDDVAHLSIECAKLIPSILDYICAYFEEERPSAEHIIDPLLQSAPRFKHRAFREENEIRLILYPASALMRAEMRRDPELKTEGLAKRTKVTVSARNSYGEEVPCIMFNADNEHGLPIRRIIVGPQRQQSDVARQILHFLKENGHGGLVVSMSETPLIQVGS